MYVGTLLQTAIHMQVERAIHMQDERVFASISTVVNQIAKLTHPNELVKIAS